MKLLLLGANGQVGWQLRRSLSTIGDVVALDAHSTQYCGDVTSASGIEATIDAVRPAVIVNAAAYTAVDKAEADVASAKAINATACETLASAAARAQAWLVHFSTDYVYDGSGEAPWVETDAPRPLSVYGQTKLAGDLAIQARAPQHLIFRTCWVFDSWGNNFLKSILKAALTREELTVVDDQWGAPTRAALIADVTAVALRTVLAAPKQDRFAGVYHLSAGGATTWYRYASLALDEARRLGIPLRVKPDRVRRTSSTEYPSVAHRPRNSRLNTAKLQSTFDICLPDWEDGVRAVVAELAHQAGLMRTP